MDQRKAGGLFLAQILLSIGVSLWLSFGNPGFALEIIPNLVFSQLLLLIPALLALFVFHEKPTGVICFRPIKITTCLWIFLFTFLMTPLIVTVNAFSMMFSDNTVMSISDELLREPYIIMVLIMGIAGPFCEEFVFRGVIFGSFRKSGRVAASIVVQALLFGLMHLNFNQFCYAFVIGIALGVLVEVTGSIWSGFVMHAAINASNVTLMYVSESVLNSLGASQDTGGYTQDMMAAVMCVYMVIALVTTSIAVCVLVAIAHNEGGQVRLKQLFSVQTGPGEQRVILEPAKKESLLSVWAVAAIVICGSYMILIEILKRGLC